MDFHSYRVDDGHRLRRDPLKAIVAPRPIGWIATRSAAGMLNLAPFSFFNMICDRPPMLAFSSGGQKDSVANVREHGAFVFNLATRALAAQMNATSATVAHHVDEFALAGLTPVPGVAVDVPRVAESPAALECVVTQVLQLTAADGAPVDQWLTIGQVVAVHIRTDLIADGLFDTGAAEPILRAGYAADYAAIRPDAMFRMHRPAAEGG